jgi:prevent-host-death family protein
MAAKMDLDKIPGARTTPSEFRAKMGDFLGRVQYGKETVVIVTRGKRVAVLCPPENWCGKRAKS